MDRNAFFDNLKEYRLTHKSIESEYLEHATGQRENVKYYKREGEPGHYRYYYTKEEYDAAHKDNTKTNNINKRTAQVKEQSKKQSKYSEMQRANKINNAKIKHTYDKKFVDTIQSMDKMSPEDRVTEYKNYLKDPDNYTEETFITDRLTKLGDGGNVNLNLRPEISNKELIDAGWDKEDPELTEDGYATVYSGTYCNENGDTYGNFTPIKMDPETGEYLGCMDPKEFQAYCEDVMDGRREDDLNCQIGAWFTGKNAVKDAENAAIEIHELHEKMHK